MFSKIFGLMVLGMVALSGTFVSAQEQIKEAVQKYIDAGTFPGLVSVAAYKDGTITTESAGWADIEKKVPMSDDRVFWIASMSKGITAVALMTLVDEGKVDLNAPVETYLPEFKDVKVGEEGENGTVILRTPSSKMTVRQVMCHTAGWRFISPQMSQFGIDVFPPRKLASTLVQFPLFADPGTQFSYSNLGIDIGSAIIEEVSGMPFAQFLRQRIFDPLEMNDTDFWLTEEQLSRLVTPYSLVDGKCAPQIIPQISYPLTDRQNRFAEAGGGLFSTPRDIIKFYQMIAARGVYKGHRIISEEAIQTLATKQTTDEMTEPYSLGFWTDGESIWHGGALSTEGKANIKTGEARVYMVQLTSQFDPEVRISVDNILNSRSK